MTWFQDVNEGHHDSMCYKCPCSKNATLNVSSWVLDMMRYKKDMLLVVLD